MKIFSATQVKKWDAITLAEKSISSLALMETAAHACCDWLLNHLHSEQQVHMVCGKGNNGGDGLAIARLLLKKNISLAVYILETGKPGTPEFQANLQQLHELTTAIHFIQSTDFFPAIKRNDIIIDALIGIGLHQPLSGLPANLVTHLNNSGARIISIDCPSGMYTDKSSRGNTIITATHTLSFQQMKLAFLMPENDRFTGEVQVLDIGLSKKFENLEPSPFEITDPTLLSLLVPVRNKFSHKGNYGHAAIAAGSQGMMGAAALAAKACLRSGCGKLTCVIPACGYTIMQTLVPEAMCMIAGKEALDQEIDLIYFSCLGIGPGIGTKEATAKWLKKQISDGTLPVLLDADALNIMAEHPKWLNNIPPGSVITPHPKEFERLFGPSQNDFERLALAIKKAAEHNLYIVLKGHHTAILTPMGKVYFNNTGNAGMAKAGIGDVLTGILTGLMAQQIPLPEAALLAVYLHGKAGDIAAASLGMEAMQATDLIDALSGAWASLRN